jgi:integrase/recombinase XerD
MPRRKSSSGCREVHGHNQEANSLRDVARHTAKLWRKHHLADDQTKHVVEQTRRELAVEVPRERRRTVERWDRTDVERLIEPPMAVPAGTGSW